jgi:hypothetical protein
MRLVRPPPVAGAQVLPTAEVVRTYDGAIGKVVKKSQSKFKFLQWLVVWELASVILSMYECCLVAAVHRVLRKGRNIADADDGLALPF